MWKKLEVDESSKESFRTLSFLNAQASSLIALWNSIEMDGEGFHLLFQEDCQGWDIEGGALWL